MVPVPSVKISMAAAICSSRFGDSVNLAKRLPLPAGGRQENHFPIAAFHLSGKNGGDEMARRGFGENQIAVCKVHPDVFLAEAQVADAIALGGIERGVVDGTRQFGGGRTGCAHSEPGQEQQ